MKWWVLAVAVVATALLSGCGAGPTIFRYRLTVDIEAAGVVHSASSIIEIKYYIGDDGMKLWNSQLDGVAPIVDLKGDGWVVAALEGDGADLYAKHLAMGMTRDQIAVKMPLPAAQLPLAAYTWKPIELPQAKGKAVLETGQHPYFIWVPPKGGWQAARQLFADEFSKEIHAGVKLVRVSIEPAPGAPFVNKVENAPPWLVEFRVAQPDGAFLTRPPDRFTFFRGYVEPRKLTGI